MYCGPLSVWLIAGTPYRAKRAFVFSMTVDDRVSPSLSTSIQSKKWHIYQVALAVEFADILTDYLCQGLEGIGRDLVGSVGRPG